MDLLRRVRKGTASDATDRSPISRGIRVLWSSHAAGSGGPRRARRTSFRGAKGDTLVSNFTPFERIHPIGIGTGQHGPERVETGAADELVHAAVVLGAVGVNRLRGQEILFRQSGVAQV